MDIIKDMLEDSLRHAQESLELYQKRIEKLPKGSLSVKNINGALYYYLAHREDRKVKNDYLGKLSPEEAREIIEKIEKRRRYRKAVMELKKEIKYLRKALDIRIA
jgi:hypothetical protein